MVRHVFVLLGMVLLQGCAAIKSDGHVTLTGEPDPARERKIVKLYKAAQVPAGQVRILIDQIPEGISYSNGTISVMEGYEHEIIGKFSLDPNENTGVRSFANYRNPAAKVACYPQTVLTYATLTLWGTFSPLAWPCWGSYQSQEDVIADAKIMASAAGGDLVLGTYSEYNVKELFGMYGWIIRMDPKVKAAGLKPRQTPLKQAKPI